jgi:hypothetical protein
MCDIYHLQKYKIFCIIKQMNELECASFILLYLCGAYSARHNRGRQMQC